MIFTKTLPVTNMSWAYVLGEVAELIESIINRDVTGIVNEACDVYTCACCAIYAQTGINLPIFWTRTSLVWFQRVEVWKRILSEVGLSYKVEYLRYGSNYNRPHKVAKVIELAIADQGLPKRIS